MWNRNILTAFVAVLVQIPTVLAGGPEETIRQGGGRVIRFGKKFTDVSFTNPKTFDPSVLALLDKVTKLERLTFRNVEVSGLDLKHISTLKGLRSLRLNAKTIGDDGMKHIAGLTNLELLELHNTQVTAKGLSYLPVLTKLTYFGHGGRPLTKSVIDVLPKHLPNVKVLNFNHPHGLGDDGLQALPRLKHLESLDLSGAIRLGDGMMDDVARIRTLKRLSLHHTFGVTDAGLGLLKGHPSLEDIYINNRKITDAGVKHLTTIPNLHRVKIGGDDGPLTDEALRHVAAIPKLTTLSISNPKFTDAGLKALIKASNLQELSMDCTGITDAGLAHVAKIPNLNKLVIGSFFRCPPITDVGLKHLHPLRQLKELVIERTCRTVNERSIEELRNALPETRIIRRKPKRGCEPPENVIR
ncbi:MAG: leucine-rich repeat domain-containing protein [Gemmataceae bacterium]